MRTSTIVLLLLAVGCAVACDFLAGTEYECLPCGGIYSCHGTGSTCFANAGDVPGCTLPSGAEDWLCCSEPCDITGNDVCVYTAPTSGGDSGGSTDDTCYPACSFYETCNCVCNGCKGVGSGCFACSTDTWFLVLIIGSVIVALVFAIGCLALVGAMIQQMKNKKATPDELIAVNS